jgi:hypothetical protein
MGTNYNNHRTFANLDIKNNYILSIKDFLINFEIDFNFLMNNYFSTMNSYYLIPI